MSFIDVIDQYRGFDFDACWRAVTTDDVTRALGKEELNEHDLLVLLSPAAERHLEQLAQRAHRLTLQHFGRAIFIFTPLYVSNYCDNCCRYCGFARQHRIARRHLSLPELRTEAKRISSEGIRHILMLTGEARRRASPDYLEAGARILAELFSSVGIEVYPLSEDEYGRLIRAGVASLTIYQEVYDQKLYRGLHEGGPKQDYRFRLDAPERACRQGIRTVAVGSLLGLNEYRRESFFTGLHARYLQAHYPEVDVAASFPRIRPCAGGFSPQAPIDDRQFVHAMTAFRNFAPRAGITVSTRETRAFRDRLLPLGVTRMSAGVSTAVGGHSDRPSTGQFEISDHRSVAEVRADLLAAGYQPVMHDWNSRYLQSGGQAVSAAGEADEG